MGAPSFSELAWAAIEPYRTLTDEVAEGLRAEFAQARHLIEREEWLTDTLNGLDDYRAMPWSLKRPCGCVAHRKREGGWGDWDSCSVAMEGVKDE